MDDFGFKPHSTEDPGNAMPNSDFGFTPHPEPSSSDRLNNAISSLQSGLHTAGNAGRGFLQGLTSGLSDELTGGVRAGISELGSKDKSIDDLVKKYQDFRDLERKANEQAAQENPGLYKTGELAGSVGQVMAFPETMLAGPITKGMSVAEKIGQGALIGAEGGAKAGFGLSNSDLTKGEGKDLAADTATGAAGGALLGGGLQTGVEAVKGVGGAVGKGLMGLANKYKPTQIIAQATKKGLQGTDLTDLGANREALGNAAKDTAESALFQKNNLQNEYTDLLNTAKGNSESVDATDYLGYLKNLQSRYKSLRDPDAQKEIQSTLDMVKNTIDPESGTLDTENLFNLQKKLGQQTYGDTGLQTPAGREFAKQADKQLGEIANENIEGLAQQNSKYSGLSTAMDLLGLDANDSLVKNVKTGELELAPKTLQKIQQYVQSATTDNSTRNKAEQAVNLVMDNLDAAGIDTQNLRHQITEASENFELAKDIGGKGIHARLPVANVKNLAWLGNTLGQAVSNNGPGASGALTGGLAQHEEPSTSSFIRQFIPKEHSASVDNNVQTGKSVYDASPQELNRVTTKLRVNGMSEKAAALEDAIRSNNTQKKNALVFALMQNPSTRTMFTKPDEKNQ